MPLLRLHFTFYLVLWLSAIRNVIAAPFETKFSSASFFVPSLPDFHQDPQHSLHIYAGHLPSDSTARDALATDVTAHLFFLMVKARRSSDKERIIFWFNGGPGCSSFDGAFMESGPFRVDGKGGLKLIEGGWEEYATVVFVDQPAGTGLSYTATNKYVTELSESADQLIEFLRNFYEVFPEYRAVDTYLAGESYAGQFIPYFANAMLESDLRIPVRGAAIGNGWIDGRTQYPSFVPFGLKMGLFTEGSTAHTNAVRQTENCMNYINNTYGSSAIPPAVGICEGILPGILTDLTHRVGEKSICINIYDVRLTDESPACGMNWPPDLVDIAKYLRRKNVLSALHATRKPESWRECNGVVGTHLQNTHSVSSIELFPKLLSQIKILLFVGDQDLICNQEGMERLIDALEWNNEAGLGETKPQGWSVNGSDAGTWTEARNLTYVKIFNASHMAPYDVPHVTHDMILRFMGVDFSVITGGTAQIPSNVGLDFKPSFKPVVDENMPQTGTIAPGKAKTPEQDKAMWEAYYNAGSAALILVLIALAVGVFFWIRSRRRHHQAVHIGQDYAEENIPLNSNNRVSSPDDGDDDDDEEGYGQSRGKDRASKLNTNGESVFHIGESDGEEVPNR